MAGYFGGRVDMVVNFIINTRLAMPVFLVAMAAVVAFGASLHVVIMVLGLFLWDRFAVVEKYYNAGKGLRLRSKLLGRLVAQLLILSLEKFFLMFFPL